MFPENSLWAQTMQSPTILINGIISGDLLVYWIEKFVGHLSPVWRQTGNTLHNQLMAEIPY